MRFSIRKALRDPEARREMEKESMSQMIRIYCHGKHHTHGGGLCPECRAFEKYAWKRTDQCPFMKTKTFCSACKVHCYSGAMRSYVREVMRYAGPRMLTRHPVLAVMHGYVTLRQRLAPHK